MLRRRRCGPCCSPFPGMRDIYTAVQIRGQSAPALAAGARVNDGLTATAGWVLRLARAVARAPGNFAVNEIIGWTGAPLGRLPAPPPPPWDRNRRLCHFSISTALWRCRRPPRGWRRARQAAGPFRQRRPRLLELAGLGAMVASTALRSNTLISSVRAASVWRT